MASSAGKLIVEIIATTAAFQSDLGKAVALADQHAKKIDRIFADLKRSAISNLAGVAGAIGIPLGAVELIHFLDNLKTKAAESERSIAQLNATLTSTGGASGLTVGNLRDINQELQRSTIFDDTEINKAQAALLRFRLVQKDVFNDALKAAADLAAARGIGLTEAAELVGRFISAPQQALRGLKALGIDLTESQTLLAERLIETGHAAEGQKIALDELNRTTGGQAKAATEGLAGASDRLNRAFGDLEKTLGKKVFDGSVMENLIVKVDNLKKHVDESKGSWEILGKAIAIALSLPLGGGGAIAQIEELLKAPERNPRLSGGKIGGAKSSADIEAEQKQQDAKDKQAREQASNDLFAELKKRAETASNYYSGQLLEERAFIERQQTILQFGYERGTVATEEFYANERRLSDATFEATNRNLESQLNAQDALLESLKRRGGPEAAQARLAAEDRRRSIEAKFDEAEYAQQQRLLILNQKQIKDTEALGDAYADLAARVEEAQGNTAAAAAIRATAIERDALRRLQIAPGRTDPAAEFARGQVRFISEQAENQARLNDLERDYGAVLTGIGNQQTRIDLLVATGNLTEIEGLNTRSALAEKYIGVLERAADAGEKLANSLSGEKRIAALLAVDQLRLKIEQLRSETDLLAKKFRDLFESDFADALLSFETGAKSLKDTFKDLAKSIESDLLRIANKNIAEQLFGKGGALGGIPDFFAGLFGGKGLFGGAIPGGGTPGIVPGLKIEDAATLLGKSGLTMDTAGLSLNTAGLALNTAAVSLSAAAVALGASSTASTAGSALGALTSGIFDPIAGAALGGPISGPTIVGERGPELFIPRQSGTVIPHDVLVGRRSARHQINNITINVPAGTSGATADQIAAATMRALRRGQRNL